MLILIRKASVVCMIFLVSCASTNKPQQPGDTQSLAGLQAMANANGSYHWGGAQVAKKHGVSRRFIAKISKAIREGKHFSQWRNWP